MEKNVESEINFRKAIERRNYYTSNDAGKVFFYVFLVPILVSLLFCFIMYGIASAAGINVAGSEDWVTMLYENYLWFSIPYALISQIGMVCVFFVFNKVNRIKFSATKFNVKKLNISTVFICIGLGIVCVLGLYGLFEGCFGELFSIMGVETTPIPIPFDNFGWYVLYLLLFAIIPPFVEELVFRGMIFNGLKKGLGSVPAIFLSALFFALIHQNINQLLYPFVMGVIFALILDKTGNTFYTFLIHLFNNITTVTVEYLSTNGLININFDVNYIYVLVSLALAAVTGVIVFLVYKFFICKQKYHVEEDTGEDYSKTPAMAGKLPVLTYVTIVLTVGVIVINALV